MKKIVILFLLLGTFAAQAAPKPAQTANKPEREQWFMDLGFGMFVHWSYESQVGVVMSHSMAAASEDYMQKILHELPKTFNPTKFNPEEWAVLAKWAGMKYMVFTTKHHNGYCMWDTKTTDYGIMHSPFGRDILKEVIAAFRKYGIAIGLYFSPDDFSVLYRQGVPIGRNQHPKHDPRNNPELMDLNKRQLSELLTQYGPIDVIFFDGVADGLKELAWELQPDIVVTRGQMKTPEQKMPDKPMPGPWEACFTMGTDWQYKPTNDPQKSGTKIIDMLVEIRAKGGNLLINVGPKPNGEIQIEQEALLREIALWNMCNDEGIHGTRPWEIVREGDVWFTASKDGNTVYAFVPGGDDWKYGTRKELFFRSMQGSADTKVSVLGYTSEWVEYRTGFDASVYVTPTDHGLLVSAVNGHRLYTDNKWPNRVALKIENVTYKKPAPVKKDTAPKIDGMQ